MSNLQKERSESAKKSVKILDLILFLKQNKVICHGFDFEEKISKQIKLSDKQIRKLLEAAGKVYLDQNTEKFINDLYNQK